MHVLDSPDAALLLPPLPSAVRSAKLLNGGRAIDFKSGDFGTVLTLPSDAVDPIDTIVVLELEAESVAVRRLAFLAVLALLLPPERAAMAA